MTSVYVEPTGRRIAPFGDAPGEVPIANRPLAVWQAEMLADAGLVRVDAPVPPCLIVPDTLFATGEVLRRLVAGAGGRNAVLGLATSRFGEGTAHVQPGVHAVDGGWRFDAVRFVSGGDEAPVVVFVDPDEQLFTLKLPKVFGGDGETAIALPRHPVITLHHWVHILWANQAAGSLEVRRVPRWRGVLRVLWAVIRARSLNRWRVLGKLNTIGRGCDIHPTAIIEGSTLGDNVTVGPLARVLFSRVGDGANILHGAHVEASTIGPGASVAQLSGVRLCVLYADAFSGQTLVQASVLGRGVVTTQASYAIDLNFDRNIRVPLDGALHDAGTRFLGSAFGHGARIGTGVWLASGRAIPNGAFVMRDPRGVIAHVPESAGEAPLINVEGRLRPIEG